MKRVLLLGLLVTLSTLIGADIPGRRILVLQSYSDHFSWTQSIQKGLVDGFGAGWDLWFESLDAKNLGEGFDPQNFDPWMRQKYGNLAFDLVITEDDYAYAYFVRTRHTIFGGARGLAIGLNQAPAFRLPGVSYILEKPDYAKTLNLALDLYPQASTIHIVLDRSETGRAIRRQIECLTLARPVRFDWIDSGSGLAVVHRCAQLNPGEILAVGPYFDREVAANGSDWLGSEIRKVTRVPVFAFWQFSLDSGATGGFLYDGEELGRRTAQVARVTVTDCHGPVYLKPIFGRWMFDWIEGHRLGLGSARLPDGTIFLRSPDSLWSIHWAAVVGLLAVFGLLVGYILLILANLRNKQRMLQAGQAVIATQRNLMTSLGDVIETRSEETASHVQRITSLAVYLGDLVGISAQERQYLEVAAPMHDIGKVGIPDSILKNPGKLSDEEMQVMRTHPLIGYSIFCSSPDPSLQVAATIALEHHERWDGTGYPHGKAGAQTHRLSRIVALVDVFDALLSKRLYKEAWSHDAVRAHMEVQSGGAFDPELLAVFLAHWDEFCALRAKGSVSPGLT